MLLRSLLTVSMTSSEYAVKEHSVADTHLILHGVKITHPNRLVFEEGKITKGDVARYYAAVAPSLLRNTKSPSYCREMSKRSQS